MPNAVERDSRNIDDIAVVLGRLLLMVLFLFSGWNKLKAGPVATEAYFLRLGVFVPALAYYVALLVELPIAVLFIVGYWTRWLALVLAAWCIATAAFAHANFGEANQIINFMKNLGLTGGLLSMFAYGGGRYSLDRVLASRP